MSFPIAFLKDQPILGCVKKSPVKFMLKKEKHVMHIYDHYLHILRKVLRSSYPIG